MRDGYDPPSVITLPKWAGAGVQSTVLPKLTGVVTSLPKSCGSVTGFPKLCVAVLIGVPLRKSPVRFKPRGIVTFLFPEIVLDVEQILRPSYVACTSLRPMIGLEVIEKCGEPTTPSLPESVGTSRVS